MNKKDLAETKLKFESAYLLAKNEAPLSLFPKSLSHEEIHGVTLENALKNRNCGIGFIQHIVKSLGNDTKNKRENSNFYSLLNDGTTDSSVTEKEAFFVMTFDPNPVGREKVYVKINFFDLVDSEKLHSKNITLIFTKTCWVWIKWDLYHWQKSWY